MLLFKVDLSKGGKKEIKKRKMNKGVFSSSLSSLEARTFAESKHSSSSFVGELLMGGPRDKKGPLLFSQRRGLWKRCEMEEKYNNSKLTFFLDSSANTQTLSGFRIWLEILEEWTEPRELTLVLFPLVSSGILPADFHAQYREDVYVLYMWTKRIKSYPQVLILCWKLCLLQTTAKLTLRLDLSQKLLDPSKILSLYDSVQLSSSIPSLLSGSYTGYHNINKILFTFFMGIDSE